MTARAAAAIVLATVGAIVIAALVVAWLMERRRLRMAEGAAAAARAGERLAKRDLAEHEIRAELGRMDGNELARRIAERARGRE